MILVLGLGNPLLSDDSVGLRAVEAIGEKGLEGIEARECFSDFDILEGLTYDHIIFIDAVQSGGEPGAVYKVSLKALEPRLTSHNLDLNLIRYIDSLHQDPRITVLAVEAKDTQTISEDCSPEVERAVSKILNIVETLSMKLIYHHQQKSLKATISKYLDQIA